MHRGFLALVLLVIGLTASAASAPLPSEETLAEAFVATAFGTEIPGFFGSGAYLKRFERPILFAIEDAAAQPRRREVEAFIRRLSREIPRLDARLARPPEQANFVVHVVDRVDYQRTGRRIHRNPFMRVPGACIVRSSFGRRGIRSSDALVVSDAGDGLFRRCLAEEILQGLGLLDDTELLPDSVLNDRSAAERPTRADRILVETLYDARLRPGMSIETARPLLGDILRDARRRTR
ncbi:hypothetical protein ASG43_04685 [Aureimonas sp. Leaf454]|uniref:DUF2927 domain-containing protein n=1 Tax=Aureimonas sp. Leaf454 TaxID=1736381 RepID=UPI0007015668|nr:DUF2927 domain-containing protein [Aureimonas sp. Leaf454]KQT54845.1 hypothetical protein ASG43_04685 [Aureimonas sp. Leaf454]